MAQKRGKLYFHFYREDEEHPFNIKKLAIKQTIEK